MPLDEPIVAMPVDAELHVPPVVASESVVVRPTHTRFDPVILAGSEPTVTVLIVKQPVGSV